MQDTQTGLSAAALTHQPCIVHTPGLLILTCCHNILFFGLDDLCHKFYHIIHYQLTLLNDMNFTSLKLYG